MKDESRIEETSYVKARAKRHPSPLIAILTIHILSFHIGVKLLRPKILSFTDGCWPFQRSKTVGWGEREGKERRRRIAAAGRRKTGGKRGEMTRDDAREPGTKEDSSKQQCLHSPAENTFHDPKKPGHRCIHRLSSFFSFFFFYRHAKYTPDFETLLCEDRWFNVWRSHPGNRKHCPSSEFSSLRVRIEG